MSIPNSRLFSLGIILQLNESIFHHSMKMNTKEEVEEKNEIPFYYSNKIIPRFSRNQQFTYTVTRNKGRLTSTNHCEQIVIELYSPLT